MHAVVGVDDLEPRAAIGRVQAVAGRGLRIEPRVQEVDVGGVELAFERLHEVALVDGLVRVLELVLGDLAPLPLRQAGRVGLVAGPCRSR